MRLDTYRCLLRQLPCLYAFPQCSHFSSPVAAFSFFVKRVPSLALRIFNFAFSAVWKDDREGPSTTALLLLSTPSSGTVWWCGRLLGMSSFSDDRAALAVELRRLIATEPSATALSTAAPTMAGLAVGEKVELLRRLMRFVGLTEPSDVVCECVLL